MIDNTWGVTGNLKGTSGKPALPFRSSVPHIPMPSHAHAHAHAHAYVLLYYASVRSLLVLNNLILELEAAAAGSSLTS